MDQEMELQKAVTTTTLDGGGRLNQEQSNAFIDLTVDHSTLIKMCRVLRKNNPKGEFDKLQFGTVVTEGAFENIDSGNTSTPTHSKVEYSTKKLRSAVDISRESLEENIEGAGYRSTVMTSLGKRIGTDLEMIAIQGDETVYRNDTSVTGRLLKHNDGWYTLGIKNGHTVDNAGGGVDKELFSLMIRALPVQFKQNRQALRFFCSPSIVQDYRDDLTTRETSLGDSSLTGSAPLTVFGIPIVEVPLIPENLNSLDGSDTWGNASFIWLTFPQNFVHVISRDIEVYWQFFPRKDAWESTCFTRIDDILENADALVTGYDVRVGAA